MQLRNRLLSSEYWLIIQSLNEQTSIINIYIFTFKTMKSIYFKPEVTKSVDFNTEVAIYKCEVWNKIYKNAKI